MENSIILKFKKVFLKNVYSYISAGRIALQSVVLLTLYSCNQSHKVLAGHDFSTGDWLLVKTNFEERTAFVIDSEKILSNNVEGVLIPDDEQCGGTTCIGLYSLFKDGKLMDENFYLDETVTYQSDEITSGFIHSKVWYISPSGAVDFIKKWDSLKNRKEVYPVDNFNEKLNEGHILVYSLVDSTAIK